MSKLFLEGGKIYLPNVRVSFPHLFTAPLFRSGPGKPGATFIMHPTDNADAIDALKTRINELRADKFKGVAVPRDAICLKNGDDKGRPEYAGSMVMSASNELKHLRVIASDGKTRITEAKECKIYAGCYVNALVGLWAQDNDWGKRINASLYGIQFAADGEPLDGKYVSDDEVTAGFGTVDDSDEDWLNENAA